MPLLMGDPKNWPPGNWRCSCCGSNPCRNPKSLAYTTSVGTMGMWHPFGTPQPEGYLPEEQLSERPPQDSEKGSFVLYLHEGHPSITTSSPLAAGEIIRSEKVVWPPASPGNPIVCGTCGHRFTHDELRPGILSTFDAPLVPVM